MLATSDLIREAAQPYRLGEVVPRWLRRIPLYQRTVASAPFTGADPTALEAFRQLPLITKHDIRQDFPRNFLGEDTDLEALLEQDLVEVEHTSGTSEERTALLLGRGWWAEQEEHALRLNRTVAAVLDEFPEARRVTISSPVCNGDVCYTGTPSRTDRIVGQALFVSLSRHPFLWSEGELNRMAAETAEWQPQFLDVDPVYGVCFALHCERNGIRLPSLRFILASYEFVSIAHRRILERVFGVPVFNLYGSTETGHLLMEGLQQADSGCGHEPDRSADLQVRADQALRAELELRAPGRLMENERGEMAPSFETAFLELVATDAQGIGDLVVTTLTNDYMPLIRYRIGDLAERHTQPYRTTYLVHGRALDAFATPDGRRVTTWQVDQCFAGLEGFAHYQLREEAESGLNSLTLLFVPDAVEPTGATVRELQHRLTRLLGLQAALSIRPTDLLMPESSGKFRLGRPMPPAKAD